MFGFDLATMEIHVGVIIMGWKLHNLVQGGRGYTNCMLQRSTHDAIVSGFSINHVQNFLRVDIPIFPIVDLDE